MALFQLNLNPSNKELRWFAGLWFPAFAGMLGLLVFRKLHAPTVALCIWSIGVLLSLSGLAYPPIIRTVYLSIMRLTFPVGWVLSHAVLMVTYFFVITPVGLVMRLFHDPMQRKFMRPARSYWLPREQPEKARYLRQT
jgi:saxitoxin biosynthesis operon SxtJ-like protein